MAADLSVDHFALLVFDAARTLPFYRDVLGLELVDAQSGDGWGGRPWLMMIFELPDGRQLALCALRGLPPPDLGEMPRDVRHFAFACASESALSAWRSRLASHGVTFSEEDHGAQRSLYFEDPNGNVLEVTTPRPRAAPRNEAAEDIIRAWISK